jgi:hypothetical protein
MRPEEGEGQRALTEEGECARAENARRLNRGSESHGMPLSFVLTQPRWRRSIVDTASGRR